MKIFILQENYFNDDAYGKTTIILFPNCYCSCLRP